ncbi:hypothetical protein K9L05_03085 [Candidatus Babeliales bacterium]|nr:hypothetical protein [Candidatus Babeliales bacterium]
MSKLIRISDISADKLESLSKLTGQSKQKIFDKVLTLYTYEQTLKKANEQYAVLKKNKKAWKEMQEEYKDWDVTLGDGAKDD